MEKVIANKKCGSCGKNHELVPEIRREMFIGDPMDGYWWECECRSTMCLLTKKLKSKDDPTSPNN